MSSKLKDFWKNISTKESQQDVPTYNDNASVDDKTRLKHNLQNHFRLFMQITKTHGLLRIINTTNIICRIVWIGLLSFALSFLSINVYYLSVNFERNEVSTSIETSIDPLELPAITICKLSTFYDVYCGKSKNLNKDFDVYFNLTEKYFNETQIDSITRYPFTRLFLQNKIRRMGFINAELVYNCFYTNLSCEFNNFSEIYNPELGNCLTSTNYSSVPQILDKNDAFVLILWIFSYIDQVVNFFTASEALQDELLALYVHPQGTYPPIDDAPTEVLFGTSSEIIYFNQNIYEKIPQSRSYPVQCLEESDLIKRDFYLIPNINHPPVRYKYSRQICIYVKKQEFIAEKCGCLSEKYPIPKNLEKFRFCHEVPDDQENNLEILDRFFKFNLTVNYFCHKSAFKNFETEFVSTKKIDSLCSYECKMNVYNVKNIRYSKRREVKNEKELSDYRKNRNSELRKTTRNFTCDSSYLTISVSTLAKIVFTHYATESTLRFELSNEPSLHYKDTEEISPFQFIANIGGILGMYIGMSVISMIEVFELLLNMILELIFH